MKLTQPAYLDGGIWFPNTPGVVSQANRVWSAAATANAVNAAAATRDGDPFAKYPDWIRPVFADAAGTFLDAGCGYGRVAIPLLKANPRLKCVGIDASPVMLRKFVALASEHGVADRVELFCGNLDSLPFPDDQFDSVLSCAVLLHVPKSDAKQIVAELGRVLAPNGTLVLTGSFPGAFNPEGFPNVRHHFLAGANGPVRVYTRGGVRKLLRGFSQVQIEAHQMVVLPRSLGPLALPFAALSRRANRYCSERFIEVFRHSNWFVNHHDVVAIK